MLRRVFRPQIARGRRLPSISRPFASKVTGEQLSGKLLNLNDVSVGTTIELPYEHTLSDSWKDIWHSNYYQSDRLYCSSHFARLLGFPNVVMPYSMMLAQTIAMSHVDATKEVLELGLENATYVRPAFSGDTVRKQFVIKHLRSTHDNKSTIVKFGCELLNTESELIFSVDKLMLFKDTTSGHAGQPDPVTPSPPPASELLRGIERESHAILGSPLAALHPGQLLLHSLVKPIGKSNNMALNNLSRFSHPLVSNYIRHRDEEIVVPGALVLSAALAASSRSLYEVLYEQVVHASFVHKVSPVDVLGAISYIRDIRSLPGEAGLEEVTVKTIGLKNVDVTKELAGAELPTELFTQDMVGAQLDAYAENNCPALKGKVAVQAVRRLVRKSPYAQPWNIPLL